MKTNVTKWDLTPLLDNDNDPSLPSIRKKVIKANNTFIKKWKNRSDFLSDPTVLRQAIDDYEKLQHIYGQSGPEEYYYWLRGRQDQNSAQIKAKYGIADEHNKKLLNAVRFFPLQVSTVPKKTQKLFLRSQELQKYKHYLERLFATASFTLSEKEENILSLLDAPAYENWTSMTSSFLSKETKNLPNKDGVVAEKSFSEILRLTNASKKEVCDKAGKALNEILASHVDTAESEINAILKTKKISDSLRGYERPDTARHISDDISTEAVDALITSVSRKYAISKKYYKLKAALLGVTSLEYHERNVPYGAVEKTYTYEETVNLVHSALNKLDPSFGDIVTRFVEEGRVDVYPKKGKRSGAFCAHDTLSAPVYLFLNHSGTLQDVLTFAHELGHGINYELLKKNEHALHFGTPLSTAEVASTFMEDFVLEELLNDAGDEERLVTLINKLNDDVSTIFRQVACYMFEQELHASFRKEGYLAKETIGKLFQKHMKAYMGTAVQQSPGSENWWVHWSHIRSFFYVYSYANGLLISKNLQGKVKRNPEYIHNVKTFLSTGYSKSPKDIFSALDIDITDTNFWNQGLQECEKLLKTTTSLAKKLGKI